MTEDTTSLRRKSPHRHSRMKIIPKSVYRIRFALVGTALVTLLLAAPREACALKLSQEMTPDGLQESGFSMTTQIQADGTVEFRLIRDLSKARSFDASSDLQVTRSATLKVFGKSGLLATCEVEPNRQKTTVTYRFAIARDCVPDSRFTLAESDDYKDQTREHLIGGGTFYEFRLALFAENVPRNKTP